jgi:hypothetical protein
MYASRLPSGEKLPWKPSGSGSRRGQPPAAATANSRASNGLSRPLRKTTSPPSRVQATAASRPGCQVRRRGSPPAAAMT